MENRDACVANSPIEEPLQGVYAARRADPLAARTAELPDAAAGVRASAGLAAAAASGSLFTIRGLTFAYGDHVIFDGLDLTLREGLVTTLIGANGSGKTTLFNLMTKQLRPQAGDVYLRRGNIAFIGLRDFARLVSIVHQNNTAPGGLSVEKLVRYGREPYHGIGQVASTEEDDAMVRWAIDTCDLHGFAEKPVASLSGGQRQRAWIAMALAQVARVLLLDEPTTYLDVRYQLDILRLVRRLNREFGLTVIMVLHDINQSLYYSDEVVALAGGRIVAQGVPEQVVTPQLVKEVYGVDLGISEVNGKPFVLAV